MHTYSPRTIHLLNKLALCMRKHMNFHSCLSRLAETQHMLQQAAQQSDPQIQALLAELKMQLNEQERQILQISAPVRRQAS